MVDHKFYSRFTKISGYSQAPPRKNNVALQKIAPIQMDMPDCLLGPRPVHRNRLSGKAVKKEPDIFWEVCSANERNALGIDT